MAGGLGGRGERPRLDNGWWMRVGDGKEVKKNKRLKMEDQLVGIKV